VIVNWMSAEQADEGRALACSPAIAKWLHDEVVQRLSSVVAALGSHGRLRHADQVRCHAELEATLRALHVLLNEPIETPSARQFGTVAAAVRAASGVSGGRAVQLRILGDAEVSSATGEFIADFVAETLRNAVKHAEAQLLVLTVTVGDSSVRIDAFNDGVAPVSSGAGAGVGLRLLAARALDHGGFVSTGAATSDGWSTTLTLARRPHECAVVPGSPTCAAR
jgi:hypothetical protein